MEINIEKIKQAVTDCQAGQTERFAEIYDAYAKPIYAFIYQKTFCKETAEDLTSKTFLNALKSLGSFDWSKASFNTWIYMIARNNVIDHYRTSRAHQEIESVYDLSASDDLEVDLGNKLLLVEIAKYLGTLEPRQREIVTMRLWDGLAYKEIASLLDISTDNAKMIFSRSLAKLRVDLMQMLIYAVIAFLNI